MFLTIVLCVSICQASIRNPSFPLGGEGRVVVIKSPTEFCMFLPPSPGITISDSEGYPFSEGRDAEITAISHCTMNIPEAPGSQLFYDDFFQAVHYQKTDTQVQITGRMNASVAGIPLDGGGYYDFDNNVNSPPGGICFGYDSFYNFISPANGIFCIKCCKGIQGCEIWRGETGCDGMVPGNYELGFDQPLPRTGRTLPENTTVPTEQPKSDPKSNGALKVTIWSILPLIMQL